MFQFSSPKDKQKVINNQLWYFDHFLLILKEVIGDEQPSSIDLSHTPFWVRAFDLPLKSRGKETTLVLGNKIGKYIMKDTEKTR